MKPYQGPVFIDGMANSTEVVVHSKTNFVKVVQNQLLFQKPLMLCANWYCKIVMWPIVRLRQPYSLVGPSIHSILHEHLTVNKICWRWKPHNLSIAQKRSKEMLQKYDRGVSTSWQVMNRGLTRMSPKVSSSRLYGCFKMSQIQQKLLAHEALPSK